MCSMNRSAWSSTQKGCLAVVRHGLSGFCLEVLLSYSVSSLHLMRLRPSMAHHDHCSGVGLGGVHQTLDELDFVRGPWTPARYGDVPGMKKYLEKGGEPNLADSSGYTPLHYAARNGYFNICNLLVSAGANVNSITKAGKSTALHRAAYSGSTSIVKLLLQRGANAKAIDDDGKTPLHKAAESNEAEVCKLLVEAAPEAQEILDKKVKYPKDYIECTDEQKETYKVLHWI